MRVEFTLNLNSCFSACWAWAKKFGTHSQYAQQKILSSPFLCVYIFFREIFYSTCELFTILEKIFFIQSFNAAGFRGPVHIDSALCGQAGWIWIILQSRYYHPTSVVDSGCLSPGSGFFTSRIQGSKRHWILDLDTQHRIEKNIYVLFNPRIFTKFL
jgi:hypothetical protein